MCCKLVCLSEFEQTTAKMQAKREKIGGNGCASVHAADPTVAGPAPWLDTLVVTAYLSGSRALPIGGANRLGSERRAACVNWDCLDVPDLIEIGGSGGALRYREEAIPPTSTHARNPGKNCLCLNPVSSIPAAFFKVDIQRLHGASLSLAASSSRWTLDPLLLARRAKSWRCW